MEGGTSTLVEPDGEEADFRRWSDNILHWQERPKVYPFAGEGKAINTAQAPYTTMYNSDFVPKPLSIRRLRPTSINRSNKPHPRSTFHMRQATNKSLPVVRTRLTLEELNRKVAESPLVSNAHRSYRGTKLLSSQRARPLRGIEKPAKGIVPEIPRDGEKVETRLFPCIPRNARLTADRATKITNAMIKPRGGNKNRHNLKGSVHAIMHGEDYETNPIFPYLPVKDLNRPALKPLTGRSDTMAVPLWDGAPLSKATTTHDVYGRKRENLAYIDPRLDAVVPDVPAPNSKELMFKEYAQYPKYAPQMLDGYYNSVAMKRLVKPYYR